MTCIFLLRVPDRWLFETFFLISMMVFCLFSVYAFGQSLSSLSAGGCWRGHHGGVGNAEGRDPGMSAGVASGRLRGGAFGVTGGGQLWDAGIGDLRDWCCIGYFLVSYYFAC